MKNRASESSKACPHEGDSHRWRNVKIREEVQKLSDISRQTIYNNDELEKYMDKIMEEQDKIIRSKDKI